METPAPQNLGNISKEWKNSAHSKENCLHQKSLLAPKSQWFGEKFNSLEELLELLFATAQMRGTHSEGEIRAG